jgi:hypothetical protein
MRIGAKIMKSVVDQNHWKHSNQARLAEGQANEIYIQLVDLDWSTKSDPEQSSAFKQYPIRYISLAAAVVVKAKFFSIDDSQVFEVTATQPFVDDKSIYKFSLTSAQLPNAGNFQITLTEDGVDKKFIIKQAIQIDLLNDGGC